jgi:hypothetical protein
MSETEESESKFIGRIYKITSPNTEKVYVGSTTGTIEKRLRKHKTEYKAFLKGINDVDYIRSYDVLEHGDSEIHLMYEGLFNSKAELFRLEGETIQSIQNCCNKMIMGRTRREYLDEYNVANKEFIKERKHISYEKHRDSTLTRVNAYAEQNRDKIRDRQNEKHICEICHAEFTRSNKARHIKSTRHISMSSSSSTSSSTSFST